MPFPCVIEVTTYYLDDLRRDSKNPRIHLVGPLESIEAAVRLLADREWKSPGQCGEKWTKEDFSGMCRVQKIADVREILPLTTLV